MMIGSMSKELSPRERRQEQTREAILDAALQLILENGVDKLSLREIARQVDYSPAGLYEYFGSKDEIINTVITEGHDRFRNVLLAVPTSLPPDEYLVELGMAYIHFARRNPDYFLLMFTHMSDGPVELHTDQHSDDSFQILMRGVERGIDEKVLQADEHTGALGVAYNLWSLVHGAAMLQVTHLRQLDHDFETSDRYALKTFVAGLK